MWKSNSRKLKKKGAEHLLIPQMDKALHNRIVNLYHSDHRDLMHAGISCDIQSQYSLRWEEHMLRQSMYMCAKRGGECGTNRDLPTSSLSKWHHRHELRLHSCLMAGDIEAHAWTHRSSKRMRRSSLPLLRPRKTMAYPLKCTRAHLECLECVEMGMEKGGKIHLGHASLTRSLTDCDLSLLHNGKETTRPRSHKTARSRVLTVVLQLTCLKTNKRVLL